MKEIKDGAHSNVQDRLTSIETDALIRFFLYSMPMDQRFKLMGNYPVIYEKLFPGVSSGVIQAAVNDELAKVS